MYVCMCVLNLVIEAFYVFLIETLYAIYGFFWSSRHGTAETSPTRNHKVVSSIPGLAQWIKDSVLP